jgi:hypothetical protein
VGGFGSRTAGAVAVGGFGSGTAGAVTVGGFGSGTAGTVTVGGFGSGAATPVSNSAPACKGAPKAPKPTRNTASEDAQARLALIFTGYAIPSSQDVWLTP